MFANLAKLIRYRGLISSLLARELKARYRGSALGFLWSFINPLLLLLIYSFVFTTVMPNETKGVQPYQLFMFCGILPWTLVLDLAQRCGRGSLISGGNLIKKVLFPAEVLPLVSVLTNRVHFFLGLPILIAFLLIYSHYPNPSQPDVVPGGGSGATRSSTSALALILSALSVHFRDIKDILANLLTLWFFATPIIYPWFQPSVQKFHTFFDINPFTHLAVSYQEILFFDAVGHWRWLLALGAGSVLLFLAVSLAPRIACATPLRRPYEPARSVLCEREAAVVNAIELVNVSKVYRRYGGRQFSTLKSALLQRSILRDLRPSETFPALTDVSFKVPKGSTYGVMGRNGSGKSTTLKLVAGITKPTSGTVRVEGRISALIELGAGFHPEISGRENVFINGIMLGLTKREIQDRFDEIVEFAEVREFIDAPVKTYSSGMYMRLGFAVAIRRRSRRPARRRGPGGW